MLYEHDLIYDARAITDALRGANCGRLIEPLLPAVPSEHHHEIPDQLAETTVSVFGQQDPISSVRSRLQAGGVTVTDSSATDPDVILLSEQLERSESWSAANDRWMDAAATFVKIRLTATGWRLGPVLTPASTACLNCVYSRVDANRAGGQLFSETVAGKPPHLRAYTDVVTELLFRTLLGEIPRYLDEQFVVYDQYEQTVQTPRVFALPNCEVCDGI